MLSRSALHGATSYKLAWRQARGDFEAGNATTTGGSATITVSGYGQWVVQVEGCNDAGCGPAVTAQVEVEPPPQPDGLSVSVAASPASPPPGEVVNLSAVIANPPAGAAPSYFQNQISSLCPLARSPPIFSICTGNSG